MASLVVVKGLIVCCESDWEREIKADASNAASTFGSGCGSGMAFDPRFIRSKSSAAVRSVGVFR